MYLSYYRLSAKPFQISADPRFLWLGDDHKEALANFRYGLAEGNGYVVLVGAVGTGKTTLVNALLAALDERVIVASMNHPTLAVDEFLAFIARSFDPTAVIAGKADCLLFFKDFLQRSHAQAKSVLLVIDEAHRLSTEMLEEIRLLSNIEQDGRKLINIFFVGQTELLHKLRSPACRALRQRITLFYHLRPLAEADTANYVVHRLKVAGTEERLFTPQALQAIHALSRGYPRVINKLCDRTLLTGYIKEKKTIGAAIIHECAREIGRVDPTTASIAKLPAVVFAGRRGPRPVPRGLPATVEEKEEAPSLAQERAASSHRIATLRSAVHAATSALPGTLGVVIAKNRKSARAIAATAVAALLLVGGMALVRSRPDTAETTQAQDPNAAVPEEAYTLANYSLPAPSRSAEPAAVPLLGPVAVAPTALAEPDTGKAAPSAVTAPSTPQKAAALLDQQDYKAAVALLEAGGGPTTAHRAETGKLYARALVGRAAELMKTSPDEAQALLRKAVAADPDNGNAHLQLGNMYTRAKDYDQAIDHYQKAAQLDPRSAEAPFNLGYIYASTGKYTSAEEMLVRAVALKPAYLDKALFNLAVVRQKIGKHRESLAALEAAVAIRPDNQKAQAYLNALKADGREER
ncbi:MAG: AAA family ATPase [Desulfobacterales bacterium]|nr:AAA family ATPase [Desulfobacterales bacterium]